MSTPKVLSYSRIGVSVRSTGLEGAVGGTPLLRLRPPAGSHPGLELYAKAEWFNPGASVKDRAALAMLEDGEGRGLLRSGKTILEATSGNTGIALAMLGAAKGYPVRVCLPANASRERKKILRAYGAELIETSALEGTDGAILKARELAAAEPDRYFYPDQYNNHANWGAHYRTTAEEIWGQTDGRITHFVAGLGTSGTFIGCCRRLKELSPSIHCVSFQPDSPMHAIEGLKHMETAMVPGIYDPSLADETMTVSTEASHAACRRLARDQGLFTGLSSGAAFVAASRIAERIGQGVIVTIFPDGGDKYLSEGPWNHDSDS
ncbi:MAG: PLP-dependent cysteine synthase family protein [Vicinamibacteria bacterium]